MKIISKFINNYTFVKNTYFQILIALLVLYFIFQLLRTSHNNINKEAFTQKEKFIVKKSPNDIYDSFYTSIYDDLVYDANKNAFEIKEIMRATNMKPNTSKILDIGSGNGHHINILNKNNIETTGLEISKDMVSRSKHLYPNINVVNSDVLKSITFEPSSFTHIIALYFTIYYVKDKELFFKNCYNWLKPGGYLAVHLVNRDKFNPIVNAGDPVMIASPQKYAKKRITNSIVKFKDFQYKANFKLDKSNDMAYFEETMKDDMTGNVRQNIHTFYMPTQRDIINSALNSGFKLVGKIDMVVAQYEYQYIYILQKL